MNSGLPMGMRGDTGKKLYFSFSRHSVCSERPPTTVRDEREQC
jgi:hypothetical protein